MIKSFASTVRTEYPPLQSLELVDCMVGMKYNISCTSDQIHRRDASAVSRWANKRTEKGDIRSGPSLCRFSIAIVLPKPITSPLLALQSKYNLPPWQPKIDLHITLVSPFSTSETAKALSLRLASVASKTKPFTINIHGFGRLDNAESIFYAKVTPSVPLTKLADNTMSAVVDLRPPRTHQLLPPHVTLTAPTSRAMVNQYFAKSISDIPALSFSCNCFSLLLLDEKVRQWKVTNNFLFKTPKHKASPR